MNYEEFYNKVKNEVPENYDEYQTAKKLEIIMADEFSFDDNYKYGTRKEKSKIIEDSDISTQMTSNEIQDYLNRFCEKRVMVCIPLAAIYLLTIKRLAYERNLDMEAFLAQPGGRDPHRHVNLFRCSTGKPMGSVDVQRDLTRIKLGMRTKHFGNMKEDDLVDTVLTDEDNERIDRTIGYPKEKMYSEDRFRLFYESLGTLPIEKKRVEILGFINRNYPLDKLNASSLKQLFFYTFGKIDDPGFDVKVARMEKDGVKKYSSILRLGNDYYSYNFEEKIVMVCSAEKLFNGLVSGEITWADEPERITKVSREKGRTLFSRIKEIAFGKNKARDKDVEEER